MNLARRRARAMGVEGLMQLLKARGYAPRPLEKDELCGRRVAVDGALLLHRKAAAAHKRAVDAASVEQLLAGEVDRAFEVEQTLAGVLHEVIALAEKGARPVFVLDGAKVPQKEATRAQRRARLRAGAERAAAARADVAALGDAADIEALLAADNARAGATLAESLGAIAAAVSERPIAERPVSERPIDETHGDAAPTGDDGAAGATDLLAAAEGGGGGGAGARVAALRARAAQEVKRPVGDELGPLLGALRAAGVPVLVAPDEGERLCAALARAGAVDYVVTSDTDALAFGAPRVVVPAAKRGARDGVLELERARAALGCETQKQFVDLCILLGTDFNEHLPGVGPKRALALLLGELGGSLDAPLPPKLRAGEAGLCRDWCRAFFAGDVPHDAAALAAPPPRLPPREAEHGPPFGALARKLFATLRAIK